MPLDTTTRSTLAGIVGRCRVLLTDDVRTVFEGEFGLLPDGSRLDVDQLIHLSENGRVKASLLREWQDHLSALEKDDSKDGRRRGALQRMIHETAFTALNRLVALRLCEERGYVFECVRRGTESEGFRLFERLSGGLLGSRGQTYRVFLTELFRDLSTELGVLFDVEAPQSVVMPGSATVEAVLTELGANSIAGVWEDDETIGWVFQYFNSAKEREDMRKASAAPRSSRELAVRNQFFTPRYVVEFLVDNTLGRIWYEMRRGRTHLAEECRYLVSRPNEVFLAEREPPPDPDTNARLSEEVSHYVGWRDKKDPRDLRVIDPACGSGHFLLYAFEVLIRIYDEAWEDTDAPVWSTTGRRLCDDYATRGSIDSALPRLIIEHNLSGIDIDPRAAQVASLALWLRAQRYGRDRAVQLDPILSGSVVSAEPVPLESDLLGEFTREMRPMLLGQLTSALVHALEPVGELGVLLKTDRELAQVIADAKEQWAAASREEQLALLPELADRALTQGSLFDVSGVTDEEFWTTAEAAIMDALAQYARRVQDESPIRRRLFSTDAQDGLRFLDLCRQRYDVVLMNPPFGQAAKDSKSYLDATYGHSKNDLSAVFVERGLELLLPSGRLGAITPRTGFFLSSFQTWREEVLLKQAALAVVADLGDGVLDALVETAAYCLQASRGPLPTATFLRLTKAAHKEVALLEAVRSPDGVRSPTRFEVDTQSFKTLPNSAFVYWVSEDIRRVFSSLPAFENPHRIARAGLQTSDDFRWLRLWHEAGRAGRADAALVPFSKGDASSSYYRDFPVCVRWGSDGRLLKAWKAEQLARGKITANNSKCWNESLYMREGLTWPTRPHGRGGFAHMPPGCIFSIPAMGLFSERNEHWALMALVNSEAYLGLLHLLMPRGSGGSGQSLKYEAGYVTSVPLPDPPPEVAASLGQLARQLWGLWQGLDTVVETSHAFVRPPVVGGETFASGVAEWSGQLSNMLSDIASANAEVNRQCFALYNFDDQDRRTVLESLGETFDAADENGDEEDAGTSVDPRELAVGLLSYAVGVAFGRFDVRFASGELPVPALPNPFEPLPACSRGMLLGSDGPSLGTEPEGYPLRVSHDGVMVDDPGLRGAAAHDEDIVSRVRGVLGLLWGDNAEEIEQEICELLGARRLRDFFRKPSGFFAEHLKSYSKSRRQAPIYWPLSTASGSYCLWLYCPCLDEDLLYTAVNRYLEPKMAAAGRRIADLDAQLPMAMGKEATDLRREHEELTELQGELADLRAELLRVTALPYKPDLDDGVLISAAPLAGLFRLTKWRKDLEACWKKLEKGEYDWSHLAMAIWPERVREASQRDRSTAIVHGVDGEYWE